jgi:hypothetical protein
LNVALLRRAISCSDTVLVCKPMTHVIRTAGSTAESAIPGREPRVAVAEALPRRELLGDGVWPRRLLGCPPASLA